ncbi:glycerol-3-phosphate 1-O-acyltransferase PlsY [Candidatus Soleaferrea massiliensis]|uniref:glycerol-3-phosphate 1-O-acyltransferase PlsY n=1 Tax=Candidatus Soleaferrea massiliensis TaxID=1470354 RepID=UPI00058B3E0C|nr:glycerol-3-phosphate 1-O-acyltransferase PlsY [Candidatus Soleaferrea massiliensis]
MEIMILMSLAVAAIGYLLGSINFGLLVSKVYYKQDIRDFGSGNAGMTNILRTYGKWPAAVTLLGDLLKGVAAVLLSRWLFSLAGIDAFDGAYIGGFFAILGHLYPLYFRFKGGKGVLVSAGIVLIINPMAFLFCAAVFAVTVGISRIVSLGSLIMMALFPVFTYFYCFFTGKPVLVETIFALLIAAISFFCHRENIKRLMNGTENKFGKKKQDKK